MRRREVSSDHSQKVITVSSQSVTLTASSSSSQTITVYADGVKATEADYTVINGLSGATYSRSNGVITIQTTSSNTDEYYTVNKGYIIVSGVRVSVIQDVDRLSYTFNQNIYDYGTITTSGNFGSACYYNSSSKEIILREDIYIEGFSRLVEVYYSGKLKYGELEAKTIRRYAYQSTKIDTSGWADGSEKTFRRWDGISFKDKNDNWVTISYGAYLIGTWDASAKQLKDCTYMFTYKTDGTGVHIESDVVDEWRHIATYTGTIRIPD